MAEKAIVFDMDGVLFDTERMYMEAWREVAQERGIEDIEGIVLDCVGRNYNDTRELFVERFGESFPYAEYMGASAACFREKVAREGLPVKKGVFELLAWLKAEGYRIALASSTAREGVERHIKQAGIEDYFEVVIGGDMVEHSKPQPDIYLLACERLGVEPAGTYAVEDSPNGIRSAFAAGMKVIMVPDVIAPEPWMKELLYCKKDSLLEVLTLLQQKSAVRIPLEGISNTRDLGGYKAQDGRVICAGKLLRSGALAASTEADRQKLVREYHLQTIIDFRTASERRGAPDPVLPGVTAIDNPILEEAVMGITREEMAPVKTADGQEQEKTAGTGQEQGGSRESMARRMMQAVQGIPGGPMEYMKQMYVNLITAPYSRSQYRRFFEILLDGGEGAILWHCSAGKDRVGVGTALLLSALGIPREQIVADYMQTNELTRRDVDILMKKVTAHIDSSTQTGREAVRAIRLLFAVEEDYICSVFERMESECGSVDAFLELHMGLTTKRRKKLCDMYLTEEQ